MSEHIYESANQELADYIARCRAMHRSHVAPVPRFAHAVAPQKGPMAAYPPKGSGA